VSGKQTIGLTLTAWLIVTALGFAVASCAYRDEAPPCPGIPRSWPEALTLAATAPAEVLSVDERVRLESKCRARGDDPYTQPGYVICSGAGGRDWIYTASDVAPGARYFIQ
jgi:hypothetical protein